jgi:HEAT repeat protein
MKDSTWNEIVALLTGSDMDAWVSAATRIHSDSEPEDVPRLLELLKHKSFFVREAAAWPLAELAGPSVLPELLLAAYSG